MSLGTAALKATAAPWLAAIEPFWPLIWRALVVIAVFWAGWHYGGKSAEKELEQFKTDQAVAAAVAVSQMATEVAERDLDLAELKVTHAQELTDLRAEQSARPVPSLRVCPPVAARPVSRVSGSGGAGSSDGRGEGQLPVGVGASAGVDIGPVVQRIIDRADIVRLKCIHQENRTDYLAAQKPMTIPVK